MRLGSPLLLDEVLVKHPRLTVIAAHCGAPWFMELAAVAVRHPNLWIDVSALPFYPLPVRYMAIVSMIAAGLGGRLLFGSDFPVASPADWARWLTAPWRLSLAARLAAARFGRDDLDGLMGGNARRLIGL
jgi:predicted TIM-barrel fold metal-dependent hydrolase